MLSVFSIATYASHIIGGHMSYEVLSNTGNVYQVVVRMEMYKDGNAAAALDESLSIAFYEMPFGSNGYEWIETKEIDRREEIEVIAQASGGCFFTAEVSERASYEVVFEVPDNGRDYIFVHQRCCRSADIINIKEADQTGLAMHLIITSEGLDSYNKSHILTNPMDRYLELDQTNEIIIALDESTDEYRTEFVIPFKGGGPEGMSGFGGDINSCNGLIPDLEFCSPPFGKVKLHPNISEESLFSENSPFEKISELEYHIEPKVRGAYQIAYYIHEFRDSVLLSSHYSEQVYDVIDCGVLLDSKDLLIVQKADLYPNPVHSNLHIRVSVNDRCDEVTIVDVNGCTVKTIEQDNINSINVESLVRGLYFLRLVFADEIELHKFIKS